MPLGVQEELDWSVRREENGPQEFPSADAHIYKSSWLEKTVLEINIVTRFLWTVIFSHPTHVHPFEKHAAGTNTSQPAFVENSSGCQAWMVD